MGRRLVRLRALLASSWVVWLAAGLAFVLTLGTLDNGLVLDDHFQRRVAVEGVGYFDDDAVHPLDQFALLPSSEARQRGVEAGMWPWWISDIKLRFFRPLSAITHLIDYRLWPDQPWLMHLHSSLWYALLAALVALLFRRLWGPTWVAGLAALLFAVDDGHAYAVGWLAARNMLIATTFGVLALLFHHRARAEDWSHGRWLSPLMLLAALLSAEFGIGALGYLVAYAALRETGWARLTSVLPHVAVVVAWQLAYSALGYGASGTGLYVHPLVSPGAFVVAVVERWPVLMASQLTLPIADAWLMTPSSWTEGIAVGSLVVVVVIGAALGRALRERRELGWLVAGAALAAVPSCTTFPNERLLYFVSVAAAAVFAVLIHEASRTSASRALRVGTGLAWLRHGALAVLLFLARGGGVTTTGKMTTHADATLPSDDVIRTQTLVVVNTPHTFLTSFPSAIRRFERRPGPERIRTLGATVAPVAVTRIDAHTLELATSDGYGGAHPYEIFWEPGAERRPGYRVDLGDLVVEVLESTPDGRHSRVRVRFNEPLEAPRWRFVAWIGEGFAPFELPSVGETVTLPAIDILAVLSAAS